jgi:hypothetical protein
MRIKLFYCLRPPLVSPREVREYLTAAHLITDNQRFQFFRLVITPFRFFGGNEALQSKLVDPLERKSESGAAQWKADGIHTGSSSSTKLIPLAEAAKRNGTSNNSMTL